MNDKEKHVLINTEEHGIKSSLQWKRTDGQQAYEVLGCRTENLIRRWKLPATERNCTWVKIDLKLWMSSPIPLSLVLRCLGFCCCLCSVPTRQMWFQSPSYSLHRQTHTHTNHAATFLQLKDFLSPGNGWLSLFQTKLAVQFNKRFWTSSWSLT